MNNLRPPTNLGPLYPDAPSDTPWLDFFENLMTWAVKLLTTAIAAGFFIVMYEIYVRHFQ